MEEIKSIKDSVDYSDGSVVSHTVINKPEGTVSIFSFDAGQGLSEHTAPFDAVVNVLDGKAEISIGGGRHVVSAGEYLVMPANKPHSLQAVEKFKMLLIMVKSK